MTKTYCDICGQEIDNVKTIRFIESGYDISALEGMKDG